MAHFARLDNNNFVVRVAKVDDLQCCDPKDGLEKEEVGVAYLQALHGRDTKWVQTSYNNNFRKNYAYKGCVYDEARDGEYQVKESTYLNRVLVCWWVDSGLVVGRW